MPRLVRRRSHDVNGVAWRISRMSRMCRKVQGGTGLRANLSAAIERFGQDAGNGCFANAAVAEKM